MKLKVKLVLYYMLATLLTAFIVGLAVLKSIETLSIHTIEKQLIQQSDFAGAYISQIHALQNENNENLGGETAKAVISNLGLILGNIRIYDPEIILLASSQNSFENTEGEMDNSRVLGEARKGHFAYFIKNDKVFFASPIYSGNNTIGLLNIIYPMSFFKNLITSVTNILLIGASFFIVIMALLSFYIAGRVTKPVITLANTAKQYANRNFVPVKITSKDEIAQLGRSFNAMGSKLNDYIKMQQQFVSNVSHEIRTPLTAIIGYSEIISNEAIDRPDLQKAVFHLKNESKRLIELVDKFLALTKIDSDKEIIDFSRTNLSEITNTTIEKMRIGAQKYGIKIDSQIEPEVFVLADNDKLVQVLVNLLDNAIKFSHPNTIVSVVLNKEQNMGVISIKDNGVGIPAENLSKIFERFYRAENTGGVPGTGLGLAIVKEIIDAHKGIIEIKSEVDVGTTVTLKIPTCS